MNKKRTFFEMSGQAKRALEIKFSAAQASLEGVGVELKLIEPSPSLLADEERSYFVAECTIENHPDQKLTVRINTIDGSVEALLNSSDTYFLDPRKSLLRSLLQQQENGLICLLTTWKNVSQESQTKTRT